MLRESGIFNISNICYHSLQVCNLLNLKLGLMILIHTDCKQVLVLVFQADNHLVDKVNMDLSRVQKKQHSLL